MPQQWGIFHSTLKEPVNTENTRTLLLQVLVQGAAAYLATAPYEAKKIGEGINNLLDVVAPKPTSETETSPV